MRRVDIRAGVTYIGRRNGVRRTVEFMYEIAERRVVVYREEASGLTLVADLDGFARWADRVAPGQERAS